MRTIMVGVFFYLGSVGLLLADDRGQSDMFISEEKPDYTHLTEIPDSGEKSKEEKCLEMSKKIENLDGKPQKHFVASKVYSAECER